MDLVTIGALLLGAAYIALHVYAWRNQHKPFWYGFTHWMG